MELRQYFNTIRRWLWLILLATAVATVSSYLATRQQPPIYRATATLMVGRITENPNPNSNDVYLGQQLARTYAELAKRRAVRQATMEALGLSWLPEYTVNLVPNTQLLEITTVDSDPQRAAIVADALAEQLIRQSPSESELQRQEDQAFVTEQLADLRANITETEDRIDELQEQLAGMFSARQIADTQAEIAALEQKKNTYQATYASLLGFVEGGINTVRLQERAQVPRTPVGPNTRMTILLAAAIGLLLALGAAFLLDYLDDTLKDSEDIERATGLSTLGTIAHTDGESRAGNLVAFHSPQSSIAESFRMLRTNIQFSSLDNPPRTLLVTGPHPNVGKSSILANLAVVMAQQGQRVVIIDTDLRRPTLHRYFQLPNKAGLTNALLQEKPSADGLMQPTMVENLWALTTGPLPPNPAELLGSARFGALLAEIQKDADVVLLDSPPVLVVADAAIASRQVDGVLFVVSFAETRRQLAASAVEALNRVGANMLGVVVTGVKQDARSYSDYYSTHGEDAETRQSPRGWRRWLPGMGSGR